tara:strand:- start:67 stop:1896 length:1830 start_codon:yes stop_codon:yes gene_type:complete
MVNMILNFLDETKGIKDMACSISSLLLYLNREIKDENRKIQFDMIRSTLTRSRMKPESWESLFGSDPYDVMGKNFEMMKIFLQRFFLHYRDKKCPYGIVVPHSMEIGSQPLGRVVYVISISSQAGDTHVNNLDRLFKPYPFTKSIVNDEYVLWYIYGNGSQFFDDELCFTLENIPSKYRKTHEKHMGLEIYSSAIVDLKGLKLYGKSEDTSNMSDNMSQMNRFIYDAIAMPYTNIVSRLHMHVPILPLIIEMMYTDIPPFLNTILSGTHLNTTKHTCKMLRCIFGSIEFSKESLSLFETDTIEAFWSEDSQTFVFPVYRNKKIGSEKMTEVIMEWQNRMMMSEEKYQKLVKEESVNKYKRECKTQKEKKEKEQLRREKAQNSLWKKRNENFEKNEASDTNETKYDEKDTHKDSHKDSNIYKSGKARECGEYEGTIQDAILPHKIDGLESDYNRDGWTVCSYRKKNEIRCDTTYADESIGTEFSSDTSTIHDFKVDQDQFMPKCMQEAKQDKQDKQDKQAKQEAQPKLKENQKCGSMFASNQTILSTVHSNSPLHDILQGKQIHLEKIIKNGDERLLTALNIPYMSYERDVESCSISAEILNKRPNFSDC